MKPISLAFLPFVLLPTAAVVFLGSCSAVEGPQCGADGTHSVMGQNGCACEPGYTWRNPSAADDFHCVQGAQPLCAPQCAGKDCGPDGCGGVCGNCNTGFACNSSGACITCTPECSGRVCGDDLCNGTCGDCGAGQACNAGGQCVACTADCSGRQCGTDGCGGTCGTCDSSETCNTSGACVAGGGGGGGGGGGTGVVGAPCTGDGDCAGANAYCLLVTDGFPAGYCTQSDCGGGCTGDGECFYIDETQTESACFDMCTAPGDCRDGYTCDEYSTCWPGSGGGGGGGCATAGCPDGQICASSGTCITPDPGLPAGPIPTCTGLPAWECTGDEAFCGALVAFEPDTGNGWWDYPINGETASDEYRSYIRRDLMMLIQYATASVHCLAANWTYGNGGNLGLGDMSEANGAIPGTSDGEPGHPANTHTDGHDMDIAYYQVGTADNTLRPVCPHTSGGGDQQHCTGAPDILDAWRTALFVGKLHETTQLWWVGMDGKVGPIVEDKLEQLCAAGWVSGRACTQERITYEVTDGGIGWYYFHHHHLHVSLKDKNGNHPELGG